MAENPGLPLRIKHNYLQPPISLGKTGRGWPLLRVNHHHPRGSLALPPWGRGKSGGEDGADAHGRTAWPGKECETQCLGLQTFFLGKCYLISDISLCYVFFFFFVVMPPDGADVPEFHLVRALANSPLAAKVRGAVVLEREEGLHLCVEDRRVVIYCSCCLF